MKRTDWFVIGWIISVLIAIMFAIMDDYKHGLSFVILSVIFGCLKEIL